MLLFGLVLAQTARPAAAPVRPGPAPTPALSFDEVAKRAAAAREQDRLEEAIRWYREGARQRPRWDEGLWYLATLLYEEDRFAEARDAFRQFLVVKPAAGPAWALLGICEFKLKQYPTALSSLQKGTELGYGTNTAVQGAGLFHLSMLLVNAGRFELAVVPLTRLARSEPESERLVDVAGLMLLRLPKLPTAISSSERELVTLAGLAACAHLSRRADEAAERFRLLVERFPKAPNVHYARAIFLLGTDSRAALQEFRQEIEVQPQGVFAHLDLAFELIRQGEFAEAVPPAETAVRLAPGLFAAHNALGRALSESGALKRGIQELEAAAKLAPESPEMHFSLARAYAKAGRKDDAARARATFAVLDQKRRDRDKRKDAASGTNGEGPG